MESEVKALGGDAIALRFHDRREVDTQMRELRRHGVAILLSDAEVIGIVEVRRCGELVDGFRSAFDRLGIAAVGTRRCTTGSCLVCRPLAWHRV